MNLSTRLLCALAAGLLPASAGADIFLKPAAHTGRVGEKVRLEARGGGLAYGAPSDWREHTVRWMFVRVAGTQKNMQAKDLTPIDEGRAIELPLEHAGATLIGMDIVAPVAEMPGEQLAPVLRQTNAADKADEVAKGGPVRVRYIDSSKLLLKVTASGNAADGGGDRGENETGPSGVPQSKTGQAAEIRLSVDPLRAKIGSDIPFRVYVNGSSRGEVAVTATPRAGTAMFLTTNASGMGVMNVNGSGQWLLDFRYAEPSKEAGVDWIIYYGALTFEIPEGSAK
jgi:hypothetical protein